jgi:hypothetical protein
MRVVFVTLSNAAYVNSRLLLNESAAKFGIPDIRSYDFEEIKTAQFYHDNRAILDQRKGMGHWLWKPFIISEALNSLSDGDLVIYIDAGARIIDRLDPLLALCNEQQPVLLFGNGNHTNSMWTKRDAFVLMDCDSEYYWRGLPCDAACCVFRKGPVALRFLQDWLKYGCDERIITHIPNTCGKKNLPDFIEHRHDQSILSLLAQKYRLPLFRMPTQYGNHYKMHPYRVENEFNRPNQLSTLQVSWYAAIPYYNSPYPQLLDHHRTPNVRPPGGSFRDRITGKIKRKWKRIVWSLRNGRPYSDITK